MNDANTGVSRGNCVVCVEIGYVLYRMMWAKCCQGLQLTTVPIRREYVSECRRDIDSNESRELRKALELYL